jgi:hypothetical protein
VRDKTRSGGQSPQKGKEKIMKKAILIICVLSVLALLAVPVMAEVLSSDSDLDWQTAGGEVPPGTGIGRRAEVELDRQVAGKPPPGSGIGRRA